MGLWSAGRPRRRGPVAAVALLAVVLACTSPTDETPRPPDQTPTAERLTVFPAPFPVAGLAEPADRPLSPGVAARLQAELDRILSTGGYRGGFTAAVVDAEHGTWAGASGSADGARPMTPADQMAIGALTRTVLAAEVLRLAETGRLALDDPAADHLDVDFDTNGATVRELLAMRSGIPDLYQVRGISIDLRTDLARSWSPAEVLALVDERRFPRTSSASESATNYILLGLIVERVTGLPLDRALRAGVLAGPGLGRLILQPAERPTDPVALPTGVGRDPQVSLAAGGGYLPSLSEASAGGAATGMAADAPTLARWWAELCGGRLLSVTSLTEMATFTRQHTTGLGLADLTVARNTPAVGASGAMPGYAAIAMCLPADGVVVAVLTNHYAPFAVYDLAISLVDELL